MNFLTKPKLLGPTPEFAEKVHQIVDEINGKKPQMSITGANYLGGRFKEKIESVKAKMAAVTAEVDSAFTSFDEATDQASKIAQAVRAEADDLKAQFGQISNGPPA